MAASVGSVGDAYDNALMESTIGLYTTELIKPQRSWKTLAQVELATAEWIDWYCHRRLHGETGHILPVEYEANHYRVATKPQVTATIRSLHRTRNGSPLCRTLDPTAQRPSSAGLDEVAGCRVVDGKRHRLDLALQAGPVREARRGFVGIVRARAKAAEQPGGDARRGWNHARTRLAVEPSNFCGREAPLTWAGPPFQRLPERAPGPA
ncbi:integrase core domain-containing protein [Streptomyces avidinii]|uniref:integrase core domain-containing protein n=1 Tax=Streptomyces avidinii TaxID=1895 RepID=UPI0037A67140